MTLGQFKARTNTNIIITVVVGVSGSRAIHPLNFKSQAIHACVKTRRALLGMKVCYSSQPPDLSPFYAVMYNVSRQAMVTAMCEVRGSGSLLGPPIRTSWEPW